MLFFGLRYINRKLQSRWLELDKAVKKQLDRFAQSPLLYFGVMYYIPAARDHFSTFFAKQSVSHA